jgi:hypothetical protein
MAANGLKNVGAAHGREWLEGSMGRKGWSD